MNRDFWLQQFALAASHPTSWWLCAMRLKQAADILWTPIEQDLQRLRDGSARAQDLANLGATLAYMMLTGFVLECAVKGLLVKRKPAILRQDTFPVWGRSGHDLPGLFDDAGVVVSAQERDLLERLREFVKWRGRYPIPVRAAELMEREQMPGGGTPYMMPFRNRQLTEALFARLTHLLEIRYGSAPDTENNS